MKLYEQLPRGSSTKEKLEAYSMPLTECGCWVWLASLSHNGYGILGNGPGERRVHRLAYIEFTGPIPGDMYVLHRCDEPSCINPEHLFLGTQQDNIDDMMAKGRNKCSRGENQRLAKLTAPQVQDIVQKLEAGGLSYKTMGKMYGVTPGAICQIATGTTWNWLTGLGKETP